MGLNFIKLPDLKKTLLKNYIFTNIHKYIMTNGYENGPRFNFPFRNTIYYFRRKNLKKI